MNLIYAYFFVALMHNIIFYILDATLFKLNKDELYKTSKYRIITSIFWIIYDLIIIIGTFIIIKKIKENNKK